MQEPRDKQDCPSSEISTPSHPNAISSACPHCGAPLRPSTEQGFSLLAESASPSSHEVQLVRGHAPLKEEVLFTIGPYQVLNSIGKGGMGEVFLGYDTLCGRRIALKRIRKDLIERHQLEERFLREARITSQLTHPAIIPIYSIHISDGLIYYTMPYVEGETLKQILATTRKQEKTGEPRHHLGGSIPALVRTFITICQAVAYAHSKGVLHRDLKPENIIIGPYGEVLILDWGLAKLLEEGEVEGSEDTNDELDREGSTATRPSLTHHGKVVGTLAYMAPERALNHPATVQSDIYALGVILYQILTLHQPFRRGSLKKFRERMKEEIIHEPSEVAPYREVPPALSKIAKKCLSPKIEQRYQTVESLIHDMEIYLEGRSEWFQLAELSIHNKEDWEFQENVLIAEHIEITRNTDMSDWFSLMISRSSFPDNIRIEATVCLGNTGCGIGFLLSIPEAAERRHLNDGYCLWIGSEKFQDTKLLRSTVEVMKLPEVFLQPNTAYQVRIEKVDQNINFYLDNQLQISFVGHLPLAGTHIGLISRDADFSISDITLYSGNQNLTVNCLAIADAFLAHKKYTIALNEYRRIAYSFPGRAEGRDALFRAGITLLEQGHNCPDPDQKMEFYELALEEFSKLHHTPGAPMEYLGKALVYQKKGDYDEEIKCFELALRRYKKHPLLHLLREQILYRMHESSRKHRPAAYGFVLLAVRHLPEVVSSHNAQKLFSSLQRHWEPLPFIETPPDTLYSDQAKNRQFAIQLAFWLGKPYVLAEIIEDLLYEPIPDVTQIGNALFCLVELGSWQLAHKKIDLLKSQWSNLSEPILSSSLSLLEIAIALHKHSLDKAIDLWNGLTIETWERAHFRVLFYLIEQALDSNPALVHALAAPLKTVEIAPRERLMLDSYEIWASLLEKDLLLADRMLQAYSLELLSSEKTPLYFLYGCWLYLSEGIEIGNVHFSGLLDTPYPRTWALLSHFLAGKIGRDGRWLSRAFLWEKRQLYRQLSLYYYCIDDLSNSERCRKLEREEYICAEE